MRYKPRHNCYAAKIHLCGELTELHPHNHNQWLIPKNLVFGEGGNRDITPRYTSVGSSVSSPKTNS